MNYELLFDVSFSSALHEVKVGQHVYVRRIPNTGMVWLQCYLDDHRTISTEIILGLLQQQLVNICEHTHIADKFSLFQVAIASLEPTIIIIIHR